LVQNWSKVLNDPGVSGGIRGFGGQVPPMQGATVLATSVTTRLILSKRAETGARLVPIAGNAPEREQLRIHGVTPLNILVHPSGIEGLIFGRGLRYPARGFPA
jgi:hypothetical protein